MTFGEKNLMQASVIGLYKISIKLLLKRVVLFNVFFLNLKWPTHFNFQFYVHFNIKLLKKTFSYWNHFGEKRDMLLKIEKLICYLYLITKLHENYILIQVIFFRIKQQFSHFIYNMDKWLLTLFYSYWIIEWWMNIVMHF